MFLQFCHFVWCFFAVKRILTNVRVYAGSKNNTGINAENIPMIIKFLLTGVRSVLINWIEYTDYEL